MSPFNYSVSLYLSLVFILFFIPFSYCPLLIFDMYLICLIWRTLPLYYNFAVHCLLRVLYLLLLFLLK